MDQDFNLCCWGVGSKRELLEKFVDQYYSDYIQIRVKGYASNVYLSNSPSRVLTLIHPNYTVPLK